MIFTIHSIFETCSEFDGENFCKNRFLKKSFLKAFISQNFVIFCFILDTFFDTFYHISRFIFPAEVNFSKIFKFVHSFPKNLANQSSWNFCQMLELTSCMANKLFRSIRCVLKKFFLFRKKSTSILSKNHWFFDPP